jgi:hypothetical protein
VRGGNEVPRDAPRIYTENETVVSQEKNTNWILFMTLFFDLSTEMRKIRVKEISRDFIFPPTKSEIEDINNSDTDKIFGALELMGGDYTGAFSGMSRDEIFKLLNQQTEMFSNLYLLILNPSPRFDDSDLYQVKRIIEGRIMNIKLPLVTEESLIKALKEIRLIDDVIPIPLQ